MITIAGTQSQAAVLRIMAGARLEFHNRAGTGIWVGSGGRLGRLEALGTEEEQIKFTHLFEDVSFPNWNGIQIVGYKNEGTNLFEHCLIEYAGNWHDVGIGQEMGINVINSKIILQDCLIRSCGRLWRALVSSESFVKLERCLIINSLSGGIEATGGQTLISNCLIANNQKVGINLINIATISISNCTIAENSEIGLELSNSSGNIENTIIWGNGSSPTGLTAQMMNHCDIEGSIGQSFNGINGNISKDPQFLIPGSNYHVRPTSPCVDAGTYKARYLPEFDIDEEPRVVDGNADGIVEVDIGADEVVAADSLFKRGDVNADGTTNLSDVLRIADYLFQWGVTLVCMDAGDLNDDGNVTVSDIVYILLYLYRGGTPPPPPLEDCGEDPTLDGSGCGFFRPCE
jgi:hypothetical protein